jgi:hypothetical protein
MRIDAKTGKLVQYKRLNTGLYDKQILCSSCDNGLLGNYESYLKPFFFGGPIGIKDNPDFKKCKDKKGRKHILIKNISYERAKLGLLSILWRSSISNNEFFKSVKLDPTTQETLRLMLLNNDPKEINVLPTICWSILGQNQSFKQVVAAPRPLNHSNGSGYVFLLGGIFLLFYISHNFTDEQLESNCISPNRHMVIQEIDDGDGLGWILSYFGLKN